NNNSHPAQWIIDPATGGTTMGISANFEGSEKFRITGAGNVGIGTATPNSILDINGTGTTQSAVILPRDTTTNRPYGINGMIRYNTNNNAFEAYQNGAWTNMISSTNGTVTSIVSGTGLQAGTINSVGTLNLDVGTTANKILQITTQGVL